MIILFIVLVILIFPLQGCHLQKQYQTPTKLETMDPYTWDFGQIKEGEILEHNFILKNETQKILNIKNVTTSCGCTISKVKKETLSSGERVSFFTLEMVLPLVVVPSLK